MKLKVAIFKWLLPPLMLCMMAVPLSHHEKSEKNNSLSNSLTSDDRLQAEADALLPLFDAMPPVPVYLTEEPVIKSGTSTESGVAYTDCDTNHTPSISVKTAFYEKANQLQLVNILKHELTHAWLCRRGQMSGHDENFRRKFKQIGGWGN